MYCRALGNFIIIFHLGDTISFFLHFAVLQYLNHLLIMWVFDQSSPELCGHTEKSICKETRGKINLLEIPVAAAQNI